VLGHALLSKHEICLRCELIWFASRHGAPFRPVSIPRACQGAIETSFGLGTGSVFRFRTAVASDRLLPPIYLSDRQPAFSVPASCSGLRHSRDEEPDVSRRPSSLRPDRRFSTGVIAPGLSSLHVSRKRNTFRSWPLAPLSPLRASRAALSDDLRDANDEAKAACSRHPVKDVGRVTTRGAFLRYRSLELSSESSIPSAHHPEVFLLRVSPTNWSGLVR